MKGIAFSLCKKIKNILRTFMYTLYSVTYYYIFYRFSRGIINIIVSHHNFVDIFRHIFFLLEIIELFEIKVIQNKYLFFYGYKHFS